MALHYILDGYNITNKLFNSNSLEKSRDKLIHHIRNKRPQGSLRNEVIVVFDGNPEVIGYSMNVRPVEVIFAHKLSADDYIIRLIQKSSNPKNIIVVTDDNGIKERAKLLNARSSAVNGFFFKQNKNRSSPRGLSEKPSPWSQEAKEIEEELKKLYKT